MSFFSWWYRFGVWCHWYFRLRDFLNLVALILAGILATLAYSQHPQATLILGIFYIVTLVTITFSTVRNRQARDYVQAEVFWGLSSLINKKIFQADHRTRFTLFRLATFRPSYITPWYRYLKGGRGPIEEATQSRARYKRKEGMTGQAWDEAGHSILCRVFPKFETREQFEDYYFNELHIAKETVKDLSDYMTHVQTMFCYGFVGSNERTLGVLSLDFQAPIFLDGGMPTFQPPRSASQIPLDQERLRLLLSSVQTVLESFQNSERRTS